jgi:peptide/nickel transport system substrate-binding protein
VPAATDVPAAATTDVHPGKVVWMWPSWGNGRFDNVTLSAGGEAYRPFLMATLLQGTIDGELIPGLATDWSISEDGYTWTFDILEGVKFHDGTDVTMEDHIWNFTHSFDEGCIEHCVQSGAQDLARRVEGVTQTGPWQLALKTRFIDGGFGYQNLSDLGRQVQYIMPKRDVIYDKQVELDYDANPISAGQMSFVEHIPSDRMSFERFDDYYYTKANGYAEDRSMKFQSLELRLVPEEATRAAALAASDADVAIVSLQTKDQIEAGGGRLIFGQEGVYWWTSFAHHWLKPESPFNDINVRKAFSYALDLETMMDKLYGGPQVAVVKGWDAVTPSTIGYTPELDPLPFDPDLARQLLADAGYPGGEGFGPVIINTWVSSAMPFLPESAQIAGDFWEKELGLETEVRVADPTALNQSWAAGELAGQIMWRDNECRVDAAGIVSYIYGQADFSRGNHNDPELFAEVERQLAIFDPKERELALQKTYKMLRDEHLMMNVGYVNIPWGVSERIKGWEPWPLAPSPTGQHTLTLK